MHTYTITDPRTGKTITKTFKAKKGAALFDWAWNPETQKHDVPTVSFFKSRAAAEKGIEARGGEYHSIIDL